MLADTARVFAQLRSSWRELRAAPPGQRFRRRYLKHRDDAGGWHRVLIMVAAGTLLLAGAAMLVLPGPGLITLLVGAALLAQESFVVARILDAGERRLLQWRRRGR